MSWLFSRALVEAYSADISLDGEQCALWNGTPTQPASWLPGKTTEAYRLSRSGMTYRPLTADHGEAVLTSFLEAFPAKISAQQEREPDLMENDQACGNTWRGLLAKYDRNSRSWKIAQCSLLEGLDAFSETWPRWGIMHNGGCLELSMPEHLIRETESGSLLPTPTTKANMLAPSMQKWKAHRLLDAQVGGSLNPEWVEWLMGWPIGWTDLKPLETDKFQQWLNLHGKP